MTQQSDALLLADALDVITTAGVVPEAASELRRLHLYELACTEWLEKTEWVQNTARPGEFGMHRADILNERIGQLKNQRDQLLKACKRALRYSENVARAEGVLFDDDNDLPAIEAAIRAVEAVEE